MNNNMMELNMNEMEQVIGGGAVHMVAKKKYQKMVKNFVLNTAVPAIADAAENVYNITRAGFAWIKSWFN